ncbi:MAG: hypothetical protein ACRC1I_09745 [Pseudomonas proteolytica]|uniref:hypothetical protein n=1 Tax=Pseudomonas proteolytica TaxID=219574 RepID=UPI003F383E3F
MTSSINAPLSLPQQTAHSRVRRDEEGADEANRLFNDLATSPAEERQQRLDTALGQLQIYNPSGMWLNDSARNRFDDLTKDFAQKQEVSYDEAHDLVKDKLKKDAPELLLKEIPADIITAEDRWARVIDKAAQVKDNVNLEDMTYAGFKQAYLT